MHVALATLVGVGVVDAEGRARLREALAGAVSPAQATWRARLEGGRIVAVGERAITVVHEGRTWCVAAPSNGSLMLSEQADAKQAASAGLDPVAPEPGPRGGPATEGDAGEGDAGRDARAARGLRMVEQLARAGTDGRRVALRRAVARAVARLRRRIDAIRGDVLRAQSAEAAAEQARLFVAQAAKAPRGATKLEAVDWSTGTGQTVEIAIDPARGAREQIDGVFKRARRLKQGSPIMRLRLGDAERAHAALTAIAAACAGNEPADLEALEARARAAAPRDFRLGSAGPSPRASTLDAGPTRDAGPRPPHRTFFGASGGRILVGRAAAHNDMLTFRVARPHDLWLHAKGWTGAHVIVPLDKGSSCPADLLVEAAHLAAHFSEARDESVTEVQYVQRRYVRKPRGSAPGLVVVEREKVIVLRREAELLRQLLEREVPL